MVSEAQRALLLRRKRERDETSSDPSPQPVEPALDDLVVQLAELKEQLRHRETTITQLRQSNGVDATVYGSVHANLPVFRLKTLFDSAVDVKMLGQGSQATVYRLRLENGESYILRAYDFKFDEHFLDEFKGRYDQIMDFFATEQSMPTELQEQRVVLPLLSSFFVETEAGAFQPAIAYQDIPGQTIAALHAASSLSVLEALTIIERTAASLYEAHTSGEKGILHRDIKEANLLCRSDDGCITLLDMGVAREAEVASLTGTIGVGTQGYMAPEQELGTAVPASDIYSLGVMAKKLLHGVVRDKTLQQLLTDMTTYDVEDRVQRFGLSDVKTNEIAHAVVERIQRYKNVLNGHAAETLVERTADIITNWDVPSKEATAYARDVVQSPSLSTIKKIARLERYLATEPVRERDQDIINSTIQLLKEDTALGEINKKLQEVNRQRPELIFGYTRQEIFGLWCYARGFDPNSQSTDAGLQPTQDIPFRSFIETMSSLGVSYSVLASALFHVHKSSREEESRSTINHTMYSSLLEDITRGEMDDAVAEVRQRYHSTIDEELLEDPRYLAVIMTMEKEGFVAESQDRHQNRCHIEDAFGKISTTAQVVGVPAGVLAGFGSFNELIYAVRGPIVEFIRQMQGHIQDVATITTVLATIVGICAFPIIGGIAGYAAANKASRYATRNQFTGSIKRKYAVKDILDATSQLFKELPRETYATHSPIVNTLTRIGTATQQTLTPYELLDQAKQELLKQEAKTE